MTPGSLSVNISDDTNVFYVHLLDKSGIDDFYSVTGRIEKMLTRIFE
jgi:multisubunit Na+/H+ antiporter MnhE subunit